MKIEKVKNLKILKYLNQATELKDENSNTIYEISEN